MGIHGGASGCWTSLCLFQAGDVLWGSTVLSLTLVAAVPLDWGMVGGGGQDTFFSSWYPVETPFPGIALSFLLQPGHQTTPTCMLSALQVGLLRALRRGCYISLCLSHTWAAPPAHSLCSDTVWWGLASPPRTFCFPPSPQLEGGVLGSWPYPVTQALGGAGGACELWRPLTGWPIAQGAVLPSHEWHAHSWSCQAFPGPGASLLSSGLVLSPASSPLASPAPGRSGKKASTASPEGGESRLWLILSPPPGSGWSVPDATFIPFPSLTAEFLHFVHFMSDGSGSHWHQKLQSLAFQFFSFPTGDSLFLWLLSFDCFSSFLFPAGSAYLSFSISCLPRAKNNSSHLLRV